MALIRCENVSIGYEGQIVVKDLNFQIASGDYLCIVGENGSGKSTLVKSLLGLKSVEKGQIVFGDGLRQTEIGYLPQQTQAQRDFPATVWEVALSGCLGRCGLRPFYTRAEKELARQSLRRMDVEGLSGRCYRELSGGQQQRVLLARALCAAQKMLLLDEPVSGLDPAAGRELYQVIARLNQQDGVTILLISHDVEASLRYASHILFLGEQVFFGTRDAFVRSEAGRRYLEQRGGARCGGAH